MSFLTYENKQDKKSSACSTKSFHSALPWNDSHGRNLSRYFLLLSFLSFFPTDRKKNKMCISWTRVHAEPKLALVKEARKNSKKTTLDTLACMSTAVNQKSEIFPTARRTILVNIKCNCACVLFSLSISPYFMSINFATLSCHCSRYKWQLPLSCCSSFQKIKGS